MTYSWTTPVVFADGAVYTASGLNNQIRDNLGYLQQEYPKRASAFAGLFSSSATHTKTISTSHMYNFYMRQTTAADGDYVTVAVTLAAGTYTLSILGVLSDSNGLLDWTLGSTSIATGQDWYAVAASYNAIATVNGVVVPASGRYVLKGTVNGKNASSSNYYYRLTVIHLRQTAD